MKPIPHITTIVFDLNKTLVTYEGVDLNKEYMEAFGVSQDEFWRIGKQEFAKYNVGKCHEDTFFGTILAKFDLDKSHLPKAKELYQQGFQLVLGMNYILDKLHGKYRLMLLAGDGEDALNWKIDNFDLRKYFDGIFATCRECLDKEEPAIYSRILERENLLPEECLFIDDIKEHVIAAERIGMSAILFHSAEQLRHDLEQFEIEV